MAKIRLGPIHESEWAEVAQLIHRSLVDWYEAHLGQGARFGTEWEPFLIFPELYETLDPGEALVARDDESGSLLGVCFVHPRETHHSVGIVATAPEAAGRGVAKLMMQRSIEGARVAGKPLRLVSSLFSLDSFSLYTKLGFVPGRVFQDLLFVVPAGGLTAATPAGVARVRRARVDEGEAIAAFEHRLQGIRREKDYHFLLSNTVGEWRVYVSEDERGEINGVMVASWNESSPMLGPGVTDGAEVAKALVWVALNELAGRSLVLLAPAREADLIRTFYTWGARNIELHVEQVLGEASTKEPSGISFPTFLPETA